MNAKLNHKSNQQSVLISLIKVHREFQEELDFITASNNDPQNIEGLISIRQFNIESMSRYSSMIVKEDYRLSDSNSRKSKFVREIMDSEYLWEINSHLSRMVSVYSNAIIEGALSDFNRMIIARNLERIVAFKEELLHPVSSEQLA